MGLIIISFVQMYRQASWFTSTGCACGFTSETPPGLSDEPFVAPPTNGKGLNIQTEKSGKNENDECHTFTKKFQREQNRALQYHSSFEIRLGCGNKVKSGSKD